MKNLEVCVKYLVFLVHSVHQTQVHLFFFHIFMPPDRKIRAYCFTIVPLSLNLNNTILVIINYRQLGFLLLWPDDNLPKIKIRVIYRLPCKDGLFKVEHVNKRLDWIEKSDWTSRFIIPCKTNVFLGYSGISLSVCVFVCPSVCACLRPSVENTTFCQSAGRSIKSHPETVLVLICRGLKNIFVNHGHKLVFWFGS